MALDQLESILLLRRTVQIIKVAICTRCRSRSTSENRVRRKIHIYGCLVETFCIQCKAHNRSGDYWNSGIQRNVCRMKLFCIQRRNCGRDIRFSAPIAGLRLEIWIYVLQSSGFSGRFRSYRRDDVERMPVLLRLHYLQLSWQLFSISLLV